VHAHARRGLRAPATIADQEEAATLEITAGAPKYAKTSRGIWSTNDAIRHAERELAAHAEASYRRLIQDQQARAPGENGGRERDTGARMK
jgi:hypothetical protein